MAPQIQRRTEYPKETTFQRILVKLDAQALERILIAWEIQLAKPLPDEPRALINDDQIAIDGKAERGSTPHVVDEQKAQLVSAQNQPSDRVLDIVAVKRNHPELEALATACLPDPPTCGPFPPPACTQCRNSLRWRALPPQAKIKTTALAKKSAACGG